MLYVSCMNAPPPAIAHVAFTVSNLEASTAWYTALFGTPPAFTGEMLAGTPHHYSVAVWVKPSFGLHHFAEQTEGEFSVRRPGLDHLAFECSSSDELQAWIDRLDELGIAHGDVLKEPYGSGVAFWDPDGIALEFYLPRSSR